MKATSKQHDSYGLPVALLAVLGAGALGAVYSGCGGESSNATAATATSDGTGGSAAGSTTGSPTSSGTGGAGGSGLGGAGGAGGAGGGVGGSVTSSGGSGGGGALPWPDCDDTPPVGVPEKTLNEIWQDDPSQPTPVWVPGVFVTAVSLGGCVSGQPCQIFVQQAESFADLAAGSQQALKVFISGSTAEHFTDVRTGDLVDVYAHAWRYNLTNQNELLLQIRSTLPGCVNVVGSGDARPVDVRLSDLTVDAYEYTVGPLLVRASLVSGRPGQAAETFALWNTATGPDGDAGIDTVTSLSPFFLSGGTFSGLTAGIITDFSEVIGVFGQFVPSATPVVKYEEIYPRTEADYTVAP